MPFGLLGPVGALLGIEEPVLAEGVVELAIELEASLLTAMRMLMKVSGV